MKIASSGFNINENKNVTVMTSPSVAESLNVSRNFENSIRSTRAAMTIALKIVFGRKERSGVRKRIVINTNSDTKTDEIPVTAPAEKFTAVREKEPAIG